MLFISKKKKEFSDLMKNLKRTLKSSLKSFIFMNSFQNPKEDANIDQKAFLFFKIFSKIWFWIWRLDLLNLIKMFWHNLVLVFSEIFESLFCDIFFLCSRIFKVGKFLIYFLNCFNIHLIRKYFYCFIIRLDSFLIKSNFQ